jgi:hypothetical protein
MLVSEIKSNEYNSYYDRYVRGQDQDIELVESLILDESKVLNFFLSIPEEKLRFKYAPDKWSVLEVLQHMIDTERIFMHRCFRIARRDKTPLPGYEQDDYMAPANVSAKSLNDVLNEFTVGRQFTITLLKSLSDEDLMATGTASGHSVSARALAGIIVGHDNWHLNILKERYL